MYITDLMKVALCIGNWQLHGYWAFGHAKLTAIFCFLGHQTTTAKGTVPNLKQYLLINHIEHPEKEIDKVKCCER